MKAAISNILHNLSEMEINEPIKQQLKFCILEGKLCA